jgi:hypothetical protein
MKIGNEEESGIIGIIENRESEIRNKSGPEIKKKSGIRNQN